MRKWTSLAEIFSLTVIIINVVAILSWLVPMPSFMSSPLSHLAMGMNSSVCFIFAALGVMCYAYPNHVSSRICVFPAIVILIVGLMSLGSHILGMPSEINSLLHHGGEIQSDVLLKRISHNASLVFTLMGLALICLPYSGNRKMAIVVQFCIFSILIIGFVALAGYLLDLEFLYGWYRYTRMMPTTALCFVLLGLGLSSAWNKSDEYRSLYKNNEDKKIITLTAVILAVIAMVAGLAGFSTTTKQNEEVLKNYLTETLQHRIESIESALARPVSEMDAVQKNKFIRNILEKGTITKAQEEEVTSQLFLKSYAAFEMKDAKGRSIYKKGELVDVPQYVFNLSAPYRGQLLWKDTLHYRIENEIYQGSKYIGSIIAEWPLDDVNQLLSSEAFYICANDTNHQLICVPKAGRLNALDSIFSTAQSQQSLLNLQQAKDVKTIKGNDSSGHYVIAAIKNVPALSVSFLYKENAEGLYQPMRHQLAVASFILMITIFFGVILLYWQIAPLIRKVVVSERKASESRTRLAAIVNHAAEGIMTVNSENKIETYNPNVAKIFGYPSIVLLGMDINKLISKHTLMLCNNNVMTLLRAKETEGFKHSIEVLAIRENGESFPLEMSATLMDVEADEKFVIIMRDISERKLAEERLQESEARFRLAFDSAASGVAMVSLDGRWLKVNQALCRITGYTESEMLTMGYRDITYPEDLKSESRVQDLLDGKVDNIEVEKRYVRKDGRVIWVMIHVALVRDKFNAPMYLVSQTQEVTAKKIEEEELSYQANYDTLTGLVNRKQLERSLELAIAAAIRKKESFSVFFIDLDHFKQVNDGYGHDVGDELLRAIADRLKKSVRVTDVAARLGGDEFILVLNDIESADEAARFAEKLKVLIMQPITVNQHELNVGVSIGISFFPNDGATYDSLIKSADLALYRAKELGRNNYQFCTSEMNNQIVEHTKFKMALEEALVDNQFQLVYFPKLDMATSKISAVETLLRWRTDVFGDVPPAKIISVAEETDLIIHLSEWIFKKSCQQVKEWQSTISSPLSIAINISKKQFQYSRFTEKVFQALNSTELLPHQLELEIPEDLMMLDPEYSLKIIRELKDIGVQISMDNFGTGYSSLVYLHRFAVDRIKIDRGLIQQMSMNTWHTSLVAAIVALAKNLGIRVAAEGVEQKEQYELLKSFGCDEIQGFLICKPLEADKVRAFLDRKITVIS